MSARHYSSYKQLFCLPIPFLLPVVVNETKQYVLTYYKKTKKGKLQDHRPQEFPVAETFLADLIDSLCKHFLTESSTISMIKQFLLLNNSTIFNPFIARVT